MYIPDCIIFIPGTLPPLQSFCYVCTLNSQTLKPVQGHLPSAGSEGNV